MRGTLATSSSLLLALGVVACTSACTSASGDVSGGEVRPGYDPNTVLPPIEQPVVEFPDAPPTSWKGLYRDFFGRGAVSGCNRSGCHSAAGAGGVPSSNFLCSDVDSCYQTLRTGKHPAQKVALVEDSAIAAPESAFLFRTLRLQAADGTVTQNLGMPQTPATFAFSVADVDRMKTWIRNGAKND